MTKFVVIAALVAACGEKREKPAGEPPRAAVKPERARFPLPVETVDVHAMLGTPRTAVEQRFAKAEKMDDGRVSYTVGDDTTGALLVIGYERALVGSVLIEGHRQISGDDERDDVLRWAHLNAASDDIDTTMMPAGLTVWAPGARARTDARRALAHQLTDIEKPRGRQASVTAVSRLTVMNFDPKVKCDKGELKGIATDAKQAGLDLKAAGFDDMECMDDSETSATLDL